LAFMLFYVGEHWHTCAPYSPHETGEEEVLCVKPRGCTGGGRGGGGSLRGGGPRNKGTREGGGGGGGGCMGVQGGKKGRRGVNRFMCSARRRGPSRKPCRGHAFPIWWLSLREATSLGRRRQETITDYGACFRVGWGLRRRLLVVAISTTRPSAFFSVAINTPFPRKPPYRSRT